jgi:hypothetical protein
MSNGLLAELLADEATWTEPRSGLEDGVVRAVMCATRVVEPRAAGERRARRRRTRLRAGVAGVAAVAAAAVTAIVLTLGGTGPDFTAQLTPTALAPSARASAEIAHTDAGFRITLDAHGLPGLPQGEFYEAWLKSPAGTLVPIGTFSSSDGRVTLWSGVSPQKFPTLTVTIEADDGDQASSGRRVLVGDARPR